MLLLGRGREIAVRYHPYFFCDPSSVAYFDPYHLPTLPAVDSLCGLSHDRLAVFSLRVILKGRGYYRELSREVVTERVTLQEIFLESMNRQSLGRLCSKCTAVVAEGLSLRGVIGNEIRHSLKDHVAHVDSKPRAPNYLSWTSRNAAGVLQVWPYGGISLSFLDIPQTWSE